MVTEWTHFIIVISYASAQILRTFERFREEVGVEIIHAIQTVYDPEEIGGYSVHPALLDITAFA